MSVMSEERKQQILTAMVAELERQATESGAPRPAPSTGDSARMVAVGNEIDVVALATAVDAALGADTLEAGPNPADVNGAPTPGSSPKGAYVRFDEGKTPEELNASNDE
jgi:hypothetical protein